MLLRCFLILKTCHHLLIHHDLSFMWKSWRHSPRHSPTTHFLHLTWMLSSSFFSLCRTDSAIQSGGRSWPVTAEVYFRLSNLFLWNTSLPSGWCRWGMLPALSVKVHARESQKSLWVILVPHAVKRTMSKKWKSSFFVHFHGWDSVVGITTCYELTVWGSNSGGHEIFHTHPNWLWGPPSLLCNGYWVISGGKAAGVWC
jgi:hypothetical protein